ncbi:WS/DGAT/MGAT family O-acyltransferase [Parahaliea mediterranea]|uniref:WS/DGAT/MGAT family O-acyltransferase n=1 Tax=Parahaliea mediterranea TaxID=651086 RepID=UPI000E2E90FC|nr:wax ester/triacylglycerol synthase family O-acyltransferase [Parahaliea mediterranea]
MRQLSGLDSAFIYMEGEGKYNHLTSVYLYDQSTVKRGVLRFKRILDHIESRLSRSPVFRQKLYQVPFSVDYPYWVDDASFDIEFHVRHIALPKPGDWRQFCIQAARIHSRPLDMSRPAWEMYVVEGLDNIKNLPKGSFAIIAKYHHAAIDGSTAIDLLGALHDLDPAAPSSTSEEDWRPRALPGPVALFSRVLYNNVRQPFRLARSLAVTFPTLGRMALSYRSGNEGAATSVPQTRFNGKVSPHRVFDGHQFKLATFKKIKEQVPGVTVNDVVLAVVSGALRRFLLQQQELPDQSLVALVPISTRSASQRDPGNQVTLMSCSLVTDEPDPRERLRRISDITRASKVTMDAVSARQMTELQHNIPSVTLALAGRLVNGMGLGARTRLSNAVITNVPGPQQPLYFCGARLLSIWGCGPVIDGVGLLVLASSYNGTLCLSLSSCRGMLPDIGNLAGYLDAACDELLAAFKLE